MCKAWSFISIYVLDLIHVVKFLLFASVAGMETKIR